MEAQRQAVQVPEHTERDAADRALRDRHEYHIAQLGEHRRREAQDSIGRQQRYRYRNDGRRALQTIDDLLHDERYADVGELRADQADERDEHAPLVFHDVRQERADVAPFAAAELLCRCCVVCHARAGFYLRRASSTRSMMSGNRIHSQGQGTSMPYPASAGTLKNTVIDPTTPGTKPSREADFA